MKIIFSDSIGNTPAQVNRETGVISLNSNVWNDLPAPYQAFILAHEEGHYILQTTNELEADHYAFIQIAGTFPESLKNTVRVLYGVLPYTSPMHSLRLLNMYRLALGFDYKKQPTAHRLQEIRAVETDILKDFANNPEFMDYILSQQKSGFRDNYEFPGYQPNGFNPSVGRWFRDVPLAKAVPWPTSTPSTGSGTGALNNAPLAELVTAEAADGVPIDLIPDFTDQTINLDLKTVVFCFLVLVAVSILNKI